jgi:flagellar hook-associated protein FlgK
LYGCQFVEKTRVFLVLQRWYADQPSVFSNSISGMNAGELIVTATADNIANADTETYNPWIVKLTAQPLRGVSAAAEKSDAEGVDLADEMVGLITGSLLYKANAKALKTSADTDGYIFDALA